MGKASRKREADARGVARPRDPWCPACGSKRLHVLPMARFADWGADGDWHGCLDCKAVWEPFPAVYARDPLACEPCDNCAFRPGSPEQQDPEGWKNLIAKLKPGGDDRDYGWLEQGRFFCHKGVPIDLTKGPGNFLFPQCPVMIDGEPVRTADGSLATTEDVRKMRICSGFLRMVRAHKNDKREKQGGR